MMAVGVVDLLEPVEIDEDHDGSTRVVGDGRLQSFLDGQAVEEAGQRIPFGSLTKGDGRGDVGDGPTKLRLSFTRSNTERQLISKVRSPLRSRTSMQALGAGRRPARPSADRSVRDRRDARCRAGTAGSASPSSSVHRSLQKVSRCSLLARNTAPGTWSASNRNSCWLVRSAASCLRRWVRSWQITVAVTVPSAATRLMVVVSTQIVLPSGRRTRWRPVLVVPAGPAMTSIHMRMASSKPSGWRWSRADRPTTSSGYRPLISATCASVLRITPLFVQLVDQQVDRLVLA